MVASRSAWMMARATSTRAGSEMCNIGKTHHIVANKFAIGRPHLLLLTIDGSRRQYNALDRSDFAAAWSALSATGRDYFVFFNCW